MFALWKESYEKPRQSIKKQRHYFADKGPCSQSYGFSSSHIWLSELDYKESWVLKNWCFWTVVLEKTLESPLNSKEMKPANPKGNNPEYTLKGLMLKLQYFGHLMRRANSLQKTLMPGKIEGRRRRGQKTMQWSDGITHSTNMSLNKFPERVKEREAWHPAFHGVSKSWTRLSQWMTAKTWILLNIKCPAPQLFMVLQKMATRWQHFFLPHCFFLPAISLLFSNGI